MLFLYHNDKIKCLKLRLTCIVVKGHAVDIILDRLLLLCNALSVVMMLWFRHVDEGYRSLIFLKTFHLSLCTLCGKALKKLMKTCEMGGRNAVRSVVFSLIREGLLGPNPVHSVGVGQGTPWTGRQLNAGPLLMAVAATQGANCTSGATLGFSILLKDTSTCSSVPPQGSRDSN